jgi:hypothetical protein
MKTHRREINRKMCEEPCLVACVVADVIVFVLLEEVAGAHGVAVVQQALVPAVEGGALQQHSQQLKHGTGSSATAREGGNVGLLLSTLE